MTRILLTALGAAALISAAAFASDDRVERTFTFNVAAELDASGGNAKLVYSKLMNRASRACTLDGAPLTAEEASYRAECAADLIDGVVDRSGSKALAAVHGAKQVRLASGGGAAVSTID